MSNKNFQIIIKMSPLKGNCINPAYHEGVVFTFKAEVLDKIIRNTKGITLECEDIPEPYAEIPSVEYPIGFSVATYDLDKNTSAFLHSLKSNSQIPNTDHQIYMIEITTTKTESNPSMIFCLPVVVLQVKSLNMKGRFGYSDLKIFFHVKKGI